MILIGRGLDLRKKEEIWKAIEVSSASEAEPRSGEAARANLCGFEGAREGGGAPTREKRGARNVNPTHQPKISGDNSLRDPPVPIPNTEVKPQHADSTWLETAR